MRTPAGGADDRQRMGTRRTHLHLEFDADAEPISGHVGHTGADARPFTGYASLIAALQSIRNGEQEPDNGAVQSDGLERP